MRKRAEIKASDSVTWWVKVHPELPYRAGLDAKLLATDGDLATIVVATDVTIGAKVAEFQVPLAELESKTWVKDEERSAQLERDRFTKAAIVDESVCDGLIESDGEEVYASVFDYLDDCECNDREASPYLWAVNFEPLKQMESCDFVDHIAEQVGEENADDLEGLKELQQAIDTFYAANKCLHVYDTDYSRAVLVEVKK